MQAKSGIGEGHMKVSRLSVLISHLGFCSQICLSGPLFVCEGGRTRVLSLGVFVRIK